MFVDKNLLKLNERPDYVENKNYIYEAKLYYETDIHWYNKVGKRCANVNYITLMLVANGLLNLKLLYYF
ncbi:hypothetical protein OZY43_02650 [Lactobacillus sp. ESL0785]|uniref:hypothetical protein n=1 Tax=Lactobacillus sp. ESL0785 TaxID=2983232 RepID=UPI0023F95B10|nr:hypothetical protein [Lactobacillus sp. ESL0785]WEV71317.1 hypothetical protein OZY43_02650 [Lactobacillus sp. ESL0785]